MWWFPLRPGLAQVVSRRTGATIPALRCCVVPRSDQPPTSSDGPVVGARPRRAGVVRATAWVATVGLILALVGVGLLARPVRTPLQDCGSVYGFLRNGRVDVLGDPANPPEGATKADVVSTNASPCRHRVAAAARPSAVLIPVGTLVALVAVLVEVVARFGLRRRRRRTLPGAAPTGT